MVLGSAWFTFIKLLSNRYFLMKVFIELLLLDGFIVTIRNKIQKEKDKIT